MSLQIGLQAAVYPRALAAGTLLLHYTLIYSTFRTRHSIFSLALKPIFVLGTDLVTAYLDTLLVAHQIGLESKSARSRTRNNEQLLALFALLIFI